MTLKTRRPTARGAAAATAAGALCVVATISGCSVGVEAGTLDPATPQGADADLGDLQVRGVYVVEHPVDGDQVVMTATLVNNADEDDELTAVTIGSGEATTEVDFSAVDLPARAATVIPGADEIEIVADITLTWGTYVPVVLQFERAGRVELSVPVRHVGSYVGDIFE